MTITSAGDAKNRFSTSSSWCTYGMCRGPSLSATGVVTASAKVEPKPTMTAVTCRKTEKLYEVRAVTVMARPYQPVRREWAGSGLTCVCTHVYSCVHTHIHPGRGVPDGTGSRHPHPHWPARPAMARPGGPCGGPVHGLPRRDGRERGSAFHQG